MISPAPTQADSTLLLIHLTQPLFGALVGGPDINDGFEDRRMNHKQSRVSLDTNAALHVAAVALLDLEEDDILFSPQETASGTSLPLGAPHQIVCVFSLVHFIIALYHM